MTKQPWLRWYRGASTDTKLQLVAFKTGMPLATIIGCWAITLEHVNDEGFLELGKDDDQWDALPCLLLAAGRLEGNGAAIITEQMETQGLVTWDEAVGWKVPAWKRRQFVDEGAALRMRRYRAKKRNNRNAGDARVTSDTETDTDAEVVGYQERGGGDDTR